jgi:hypothetical protein
MQPIGFTPMPVLPGRLWPRPRRAATFCSARIAEQKTHDAPGFTFKPTYPYKHASLRPKLGCSLA